MTSNIIKTPKLVFLAMAFLGPIALNVYAPIMPTLMLALSTSADTIQLGMTLFLSFFALSQLFCSFFVELFGQRKVLLWGVIIHILGCILAIIANDIYTLLLARVLQATGGGISLLLTRSLILDQNSQNKAAANLSYITLGIATLQVIVPTLSGYLNVIYSWHLIFYVSLIVGLVALWAIYRYLPVVINPTNTLSKKGTIKATFKLYGNTFTSPRFFYFTLANALISGAFFTFVINVPFIVTDTLSGNSLDYGNWYLIVALGFWLGSFISSQVSERVGNDKMMKLGWGIDIVAGLVMFFCIFVYGVSYWSLFTAMAMFTFGRGLSLPNVQVAAATATPYGRFTAMGLFSFCQLLVGAAIAQLSTMFVKQNILLPIIISLLAIFALISYFQANKCKTDSSNFTASKGNKKIVS